MPVLDGLSALPRLRRVAPASRVVVLTAVPEASDPGTAALGAAAYVEKTVATDRLVPDVLAGAGLLDAALAALDVLSDRVDAGFPGEPRSVAGARAFARRALESWREPDLADTVALLLSELVTNAVVHAHPRRTSPSTCCPTVCTSRSPTATAPGDHPGGDARRGERPGLALVEALAERWGQVELPDGKVVWSDLLRPAD